MSDRLPPRFVVRASGWLRTYEAEIERTDVGWLQSARVSRRLLPDTEYAPRAIDADHAAHLYREYDVVEEDWGDLELADGCGCAEVWEHLSERRADD